MSQWDNIELSDALERKQRIEDYNRQASEALPVNEQVIVARTTTVINRRSGVRSKKTIYQVNEERSKACIKRYWTRIPHSNSLMLEYSILK